MQMQIKFIRLCSTCIFCYLFFPKCVGNCSSCVIFMHTVVHNVIHHVNCHRHQLWLKNNTRLIVTTYIIILVVFAMSCSYINRKTLWSLSLTSGVHLTCAIIRKSSMVFELQNSLRFVNSGIQI